MKRGARREPIVLLILTLSGLILSGVSPRDRITWVLEVAPVVAGLAVLIATYRRFPMTQLAYRLIFLLAILLLIGGHYTFSRVPAGLAAQRIFGLKRNHYDRVVHFTAGFVSSILARELVRRKTRFRRPGWLFTFVTSGCLAGAAFYEFLEWWTAKLTGSAASRFLAMQGDPWDTQWDMFMTFLGAIVGQLVLGHRHEKELERLQTK